MTDFGLLNWRLEIFQCAKDGVLLEKMNRAQKSTQSERDQVQNGVLHKLVTLVTNVGALNQQI